ncbi:rop guanine nucleotide exchange factor 1-like [Tasmannia lanceolata]|uniref:rop guanine nucleotide exchange factor 1-like n=1 Tax=Tasmannia lanceolata TaxID=3420 RepID=UPI0040633EE1
MARTSARIDLVDSDDGGDRDEVFLDLNASPLPTGSLSRAEGSVESDVAEASTTFLPGQAVETGKSCLGDIIYRYIKAHQFSPDCLLDCLDLSSEHQTLEIANRIETAIHVWNQKQQKKRSPQTKMRRPSWSEKVKGLVMDTDKSQLLAHRAESLLQSLRLRYPGCRPVNPRELLKGYVEFDIQHNARIDDLIYVDDATKRCESAELVSLFGRGGFGGLPVQKRMSPIPFSIQNSPYASPFGTPTFCSSTPVGGSPARLQSQLNKGRLWGHRDDKLEKLISDRPWSYAGNLSARKDSGVAPERDCLKLCNQMHF